MRYSLCMPVYNMQNWLAGAVRDILGQSESDFELILVDDASSDGSGRLCDELAASDPRIRVIHHPENRGLSESRNTGLLAARGEYVLFPDPDDGCSPDLLLKLSESLKKQPVDLVIFGLKEEYYDSRNRLVRETVIVPEDERLSDRKQIRERAIALERRTLFGYAWNKAYRRELLLAAGACFETVEMIEDVLFNLAVYDRIESLNLIPEPLYSYRIRTGGSLTKRFIPDFYGLHERRVAAFLSCEESWGTDSSETRRILASIYCRYFLSSLMRNCDPRSGMGCRERAEWTKHHFDNPLLDELAVYMHPESKALKAAAFCIRRRFVPGCLALGRAAYLVRNGMPDLFSREKHKR